MTNVQGTKLVGYPWSDLFNLVLDVKSYPEFVPHCREVRLLSRKMEEPGTRSSTRHLDSAGVHRASRR